MANPADPANHSDLASAIYVEDDDVLSDDTVGFNEDEVRKPEILSISDSEEEKQNCDPTTLKQAIKKDWDTSASEEPDPELCDSDVSILDSEEDTSPEKPAQKSPQKPAQKGTGTLQDFMEEKIRFSPKREAQATKTKKKDTPPKREKEKVTKKKTLDAIPYLEDISEYKVYSLRKRSQERPNYKEVTEKEDESLNTNDDEVENNSRKPPKKPIKKRGRKPKNHIDTSLIWSPPENNVHKSMNVAGSSKENAMKNNRQPKFNKEVMKRRSIVESSSENENNNKDIRPKKLVKKRGRKPREKTATSPVNTPPPSKIQKKTVTNTNSTSKLVEHETTTTYIKLGASSKENDKLNVTKKIAQQNLNNELLPPTTSKQAIDKRTILTDVQPIQSRKNKMAQNTERKQTKLISITTPGCSQRKHFSTVKTVQQMREKHQSLKEKLRAIAIKDKEKNTTVSSEKAGPKPKVRMGTSRNDVLLDAFINTKK